MASAKEKATAISPVSNDASEDIISTIPYTARVTIVGVCPLIFHRWSCDAIAEKAASAKGSKAKKTDNLESYVYRTDDGELALPGEYLKQAVVQAGRYRQDPRSPRKSAMDLFKAGVIPLTELAPLGFKEWEFVDRRRVVIQRNGITRERPALRKGWRATIDLSILLPEYITEDVIADVLANAGRFVGVGDNRPTFGRFRVERFMRVEYEEDAAE